MSRNLSITFSKAAAKQQQSTEKSTLCHLDWEILCAFCFTWSSQQRDSPQKNPFFRDSHFIEHNSLDRQLKPKQHWEV